MQIQKIYVKSFGKLTDYTVNLQNGLNVTVQPNGFGKSTLVAFIKAMFYGFEYKKKTGKIESDARTYMPWGSKDKFGGFVEFVHNGTPYRVERYFGATAKLEEGKVINLNTGAAYSTQELGKSLFGVDATAFSQSLYVAQEEVEITANADFVSKLTDMVDGNKAENNFEKAEARLRELSKTYRYEKGNGGLIWQTQQQLDSAYEALQQAMRNQQSLQDAKLSLASTQQQADKLQQQKQQLEQQIATLQHTLQAQTETAEQRQQRRAFEEAEAYLVNHNSSVLEDESTAHNLSQSLASTASGKPKLSPLTWLGTAVAVAGAVVTMWQRWWTIGLAVMMVGFVFTGIFLEKFRRESKAFKSKLQSLSKRLCSIFAKYNLTGDETHNLDKLRSLRQEYQNKQLIYQTLRGSIGKAASCDVTEAKRKLDELQAQKRQAEYALSQANVEIGSLQRSIEQLSNMPSVVELQDKYNNLQATLKELQSKYKTVQLALNLLRSAKDNVSSSYLPPLAKKVLRLLQGIIDIQDVIVDSNFGVYLQEDGATHPVQLFSRGVQELTMFCFRIALSQSIYGDDLPILVVDDAFVNLDDANFDKAMQMLKQLSQTSQVIYFSCHERSKTN
ncbi:MAG: AAA family ATPase [Clostridia bacterium]|nr:AAA family ATPase [Clostridia bacterium]